MPLFQDCESVSSDAASKCILHAKKWWNILHSTRLLSPALFSITERSVTVLVVLQLTVGTCQQLSLRQNNYWGSIACVQLFRADLFMLCCHYFCQMPASPITSPVFTFDSPEKKRFQIERVRPHSRVDVMWISGGVLQVSQWWCGEEDRLVHCADLHINTLQLQHPVLWITLWKCRSYLKIIHIFIMYHPKNSVNQLCFICSFSWVSSKHSLVQNLLTEN